MSQIVKPTPPDASIIEAVITAGDLAKLSPGERTAYYNAVCESIGLNPLTKPFEFINLNGKLTMYACKSCTDQLRQIKGVSISKPNITVEKDFIMVAVEARDATGRTDSDIGVVNRGDMRGDMANVLMKAVTKAKRRVTLSICGLGMLDETEVEHIAGVVQPVQTFAASEPARPAIAAPVAEPCITKDEWQALQDRAKKVGVKPADLLAWIGVAKPGQITSAMLDKALDHLAKLEGVAKAMATQSPQQPAPMTPATGTVAQRLWRRIETCESVEQATEIKADIEAAEDDNDIDPDVADNMREACRKAAGEAMAKHAKR